MVHTLFRFQSFILFVELSTIEQFISILGRPQFCVDWSLLQKTITNWSFTYMCINCTHSVHVYYLSYAVKCILQHPQMSENVTVFSELPWEFYFEAFVIVDYYSIVCNIQNSQLCMASVIRFWFIESEMYECLCTWSVCYKLFHAHRMNWEEIVVVIMVPYIFNWLNNNKCHIIKLNNSTTNSK